MKLEPDITLEQFRDEMQHRVVKYGYRSRPVKDAIRFAKKQEETQYYQIAMDKIHAQRQFHRQTFGPTKLESAIEFFTLGSMKEVVVTLMLVAAGVIALDMGKRAFTDDSHDDPYQEMDIDQLAKQLGIALEAEVRDPEAVNQTGADGKSPLEPDNSDSSRVIPVRLDDHQVQQIAKTVLFELQKQQMSKPPKEGDKRDGSLSNTTKDEKTPGEKQEQKAPVTGKQQLLAGPAIEVNPTGNNKTE